MIRWHMSVTQENAGAAVEFDPRDWDSALQAAKLADEVLAEHAPLDPNRRWWTYHTFPIPRLVKKRRWWQPRPKGELLFDWFPEGVI